MSEHQQANSQAKDENSEFSPEAARNDNNFCVVGIGASAGGLKALEELFVNLPIDSGAAFVIIQHLAPDFKSLMKELLERRTDIAVHRVTDGMELQPNTIYLIPPGKNLLLEGSLLRCEERKKDQNQKHELNFPIDIFFKSLAKSYGERSIGVILSGSGSDGTQGIRAIKEAGGSVFVQEPASAEFDGMPLSAINSGVVDRALPPKDLSQLIYQCIISPVNNTNFDNDDSLDSYSLKEIVNLLIEEEDLDFSHYKTTTISRRIERRRLLNNLDNINDYIRLLRTSAAERQSLSSDLLIKVTHFFRDRAAWENLRINILPLIIEQAEPKEELRFWVTACSTGEEAYSLSILIDEILEESQRQISVKIFATDIDRRALEKASQGIYPTSIANDVGTERLQKYFIAKDSSYQVVRRIRKKIIFSLHDLTNDAGFTRMHFISCRNVLIYLQPKLQNLVLRNLHFSLVTRGVLFLGEAETVETYAQEFKPLDRKWKIYQKRRDIRLPLPFKTSRKTSSPTTLLRSLPPQDKLQFESILEQSLNQLLTQTKSIALIVDKDNRLLHVCGTNTAKIFKAPDGKVTTEVTNMVVLPLQLPLNTALHRARKEKKPIFYTGIELEQGKQTGRVSLKVIPPSVSQPEDSSLSRSFQSEQQSEEFWIVQISEEISLPKAVTPEKFEINNEAQRRNLELEQELQHTRGNLQALVEELETTNEEQQASNEELTAANEELQSTNEELHSVNEELHTVNSEYQSKIQELIELNNDIDNLLKSTDIGVIFLDKELRIRKYTPAATLAVALRDADIDRPIHELANKIECPDLQSLLLKVIEDKQTVEREVKLKHDNSFLLMRINLYLTEEGNDDGVVLSFVKLDEIKKVQQELETTLAALSKSEARLNLAISAADIGTWLWKSKDNGFIWDNRIHRLYGLPAEQMPHSFAGWLELVHQKERAMVKKQIEAAFAARKTCRVDYRTVLRDGKIRWLTTKGKVYTDTNTNQSYMAGVTIDITDFRAVQAALKARETELRQLNFKLEQRVTERTTALVNFSNNLKYLHRLATGKYNDIKDLFDNYLQTGCRIFDLEIGVISKVSNNDCEILAVRSPLDLSVGERFECQNNYCGDVIETSQTVALAEVTSDMALSDHPIYRNISLKSFIGTPIIVNETFFGTLSFAATTSRKRKFALYEREIIELMAKDIGHYLASSKAVKALKASENRFRSTFEQAAVGIAHVSRDGTFINLNQRFCEIVGYSKHRLLQMSFRELTHPEDLNTDMEYFQQILNDDIQAYSLEKRYVRDNGSLVWVNLTVSSVKKDLGEIDYFICVIEDISDRKQAEVALAESRAQLERVNQAKDFFIAHMSHELRTPLNSIIGFSEILQQDSQLSPRQFQNVNIVHRSGKHLLTLIEDILNFSKFQAGKLELEIQEFDLKDFLQDLADMFRLRAIQKGLTLDYQADPNLPTIVKADETRLRQVLLNLLGNAVKFTQVGRVVFSVGLVKDNCSDGNSDMPHKIRFQVEDTGKGIPEDKFDIIFLPFEQLSDSSDNQQGTGLGLTISQNILSLMDSQMHLESKLGEGSKFWFDLELPEVELSGLSLPPSPSRPKGSLKQPCKILVVDDNVDNRYLIVNYLRPLGFILEEAENGRAGLALATSFRPDAILLDLVMPVMDGKTMLAELKQNGDLEQTKIFIISANIQSAFNSEEIECDGFLPKPVSLKQLLQLLEMKLSLEWIVGESNGDLLDSSNLVTPPESELVRLLELAKLGDIEAIERQIESLEILDPQYLAFVREMNQIASNFQQHKLLNYLESLLADS